MFNMLDLNAELTRLRQQELRQRADQLHREQPRSDRSPVLAALGRQLVSLGERLQASAQAQEQPAFELNTKQA
jgi:hypothetical protein